MTKPLIIALFILFAVLQYKLWFDPDGIYSVWHLRHTINQQLQTNSTLKQQNAVLKADVASLKNGEEGIEERARHDLGMIKKGEVFVNFRSS